MLKLIFSSFLVFYLFLLTRVRSSSCPDIQTMPNFNANLYVGKWYEIEKYPLIFEAGQKCITAYYTLNIDGTVGVLNNGIFKVTQFPISITGVATADPMNPSKLTVEFSGFPGRGNYWVIDTDYYTYSLVYSCVDIPIFPLRIENAWILSRTPTLCLQLREYLKKKLSDVGSSTFLFKETDQINCDHY